MVLEGAVQELKAAGTFWLGWAGTTSRLEVDPGSFRLAAAGTAVLGSLLFGGTAEQTTVGASLDLGAASGFTMSPRGVEGQLELTTDLLIVNAPDLSFGEADQGQFRLDAPLRFDSGVTLAIRLADLETSLLEGYVVVEHFGAEGLAAEPVRFADLEVSAPRLTLERLEIEAHEGVGSIQARGLVFAAEKLRHVAEPRWEVDVLNPRFAVLEASLGRADKAIVLEKGVVHDLDLAARHGTYWSRDGFTVAGQEVAVKAVRLSEDEVRGGQIHIGRGEIVLDVRDGGSRTTGSTRFQGFEITAQGPKDDISGRGRIRLSGLKVHHQFSILEEKCRNDLQLRASLDLGRVEMDLELEGGILGGTVRVDGPRFRLRNTGHDRCEWNDSFKVDVVKTVASTMCWVPAPLIPEICKVVEEHVKVPVRVSVRFRAEIDSVDVPGSARRVDLELRGSRGLGFCIRDAKLGNGNMVFSVTPTFEASGDIANLVKDVHDAALKTSLGSLQSSFLTVFQNIALIATQISPVNSCN